MATVDMERRYRLQPGSLGSFPYGLQFGGVGDKPGIFIAAKVASLCVESGSVRSVVAPVPSGVEDGNVDSPERELWIVRVTEQEAEGLEICCVKGLGLPQQAGTQRLGDDRDVVVRIDTGGCNGGGHEGSCLSMSRAPPSRGRSSESDTGQRPDNARTMSP